MTCDYKHDTAFAAQRGAFEELDQISTPLPRAAQRPVMIADGWGNLQPAFAAFADWVGVYQAEAWRRLKRWVLGSA